MKTEIEKIAVGISRESVEKNGFITLKDAILISKKTAEKIFADIEKHLDKLFPVIWPMSREDFEEIKKKYLGDEK